MLSVGSFQSQKKSLFHKIVSKFKHRKKLNVPDAGTGAFLIKIFSFLLFQFSLWEMLLGRDTSAI